MYEQIIFGMWKFLEKMYQFKFFLNMIYLEKQFFCYKMEEDKLIEENVDVFLKLVDDLESIKVIVLYKD